MVTFSMPGMCRGQNRVSAWLKRAVIKNCQFQHDVKCVVVEIACFSMAEMFPGQNNQFQHG
jgi:hypothetical protein